MRAVWYGAYSNFPSERNTGSRIGSVPPAGNVVGRGPMSSGRCSQCGAMSTLWSPTCGFCGTSVCSRVVRTRRLVDVAFPDPPKASPRAGVLGGIRGWWSRLFR